MRRTPIKQKRDKPRRNEGRVVQNRMKPKLTDKNALHRRFHDYVATLPCIGCGARPVHVHHVISDGNQRLTRNHELVLPMCEPCHQSGEIALHRIGTRAWNGMHGIEQHIEAAKLWGDWYETDRGHAPRG